MSSLRITIVGLVLACSLCAELTTEDRAANLATFETVWQTVRDRHPDEKLNGLDWQAIYNSTKPRIEAAKSQDEVRAILLEMVDKLGASHYAVIPSRRYEAAPPADDAEGRTVQFGNLPGMRLSFESKRLEGGVGYIRFNAFLDPVSLMPQFEQAVREFSDAPGIILDLRGNRGGIGIMAMGIAGFFIDHAGEKLGTMKTRETALQFSIAPRAQTYNGQLAILVDSGSASTTEILAQGLKDLKRARIFGTRTAGAALPSDIIRLPNGDGFQYAQASYTSVSGRVIEGAGVLPDVEVDETSEVDQKPVVTAVDWIRQLLQ